MRAYKVQVTVPPDRRLVVQLPHDAPEGKAEVVVLTDAGTGKANLVYEPNGWRLIELANEWKHDPLPNTLPV